MTKTRTSGEIMTSQHPSRLTGVGLCVAVMIAWVPQMLSACQEPAEKPTKQVVPPDEAQFIDVSAFGKRDISHIDKWLKQQVELAGYPSLCVAIVRDGKVVYRGVHGLENIKAGRKATTESVYHVASVTKMFTGTLAALLHEKGVIDLDEPVAKHLPRNVRLSTDATVGTTITFRQLASHSSGLPRRVPGAVQSVEGRYKLEPRRLYSHLAEAKLEFKPGTTTGYSNLGFGLLGHAMERAAGKPFDQLVQELICEPLGLKRTAIQVDDKLRPVTGYWRRRERTHSFKTRLAASGGLVTSVDDLTKFLLAQMSPGVFSRDVLKQVQTNWANTNSIVRNGLGCSLSRNNFVGRIVNKNGGRVNCSAWIGFSPEHRVGVVAVTNCGDRDVDPIARSLLARSIPAAYKPVTKYGYAKVAPFTGVRWKNGKPIVRVNDRWAPVVSVDGVSIERIMKFATETFRSQSKKRFAEDLVETMAKMGHPPEWIVTLGIRKESGEVERLRILMTESNRGLVRDAATAK